MQISFTRGDYLRGRLRAVLLPILGRPLSHPADMSFLRHWHRPPNTLLTLRIPTTPTIHRQVNRTAVTDSRGSADRRACRAQVRSTEGRTRHPPPGAPSLHL